MGIRLHICGSPSVLPCCKQSQETSLDWERDKGKKNIANQVLRGCKVRAALMEVESSAGWGAGISARPPCRERCKTQEVLNSALALGLDLVAEGAGYEQECGKASEY